jgi:hypothetical protein
MDVIELYHSTEQFFWRTSRILRENQKGQSIKEKARFLPYFQSFYALCHEQDIQN